MRQSIQGPLDLVCDGLWSACFSALGKCQRHTPVRLKETTDVLTTSSPTV